MDTSPAYRNTVALSLLLLGVALVALSFGAIVEFIVDAAYGQLGADYYQWAYRGLVLGIALLYLAAGLALLRARPRSTSQGPEPSWVAAGGIFLGARMFSLVLLLLGGVLLFNFTDYGRHTDLAAVLMLCGGLGFLASILFRRSDPNVRAAGAIVGILVGILLTYAQVALGYTRSVAGTYGPWEITSLVLPYVLGPLAIVVAACAALLFCYVHTLRAAFTVYLLSALAALVYGVGIALASLIAFLETPWGEFADAGGYRLASLLSLVAGIALLAVAGVATIIAALLGTTYAAGGISKTPKGTPGTTPVPSSLGPTPRPSEPPKSLPAQERQTRG